VSAVIPLSDPVVASRRLLFHDERAAEDRDPQLLASRLAQHYSLLDFGPRPGFEHSFLHRSVVARVGELLLTGGYTSPVQGTMGEMPEVVAVNLCCSGAIDYWVDHQSLRIDENRPLFYVPGVEYSYHSEHFNGLVFHLDRRRLIATAASMAGLGSSLNVLAAQLEAPRVIAFDGQRNERFIRLLLRVFALLDDPYPDFSSELSCLAIDDLVYRTLVQLLCPGLSSIQQNQRLDAASAREGILDELLDWLRSDLSTPVSLTAMEQRTGYSKRTLQLAFHQRFGCGPVQWVRRQRLEQVRRALLDPSAGETVSSIANRFGYANLSALSRDFSAQYGQRPSDLLRLGKRTNRSTYS
jgi:AraC-like DNA-binding protein